MTTLQSVRTVDDAVEAVGLGRFQWQLLGLSGLVWAGDAVEVIGVGSIIPVVAATFGLEGAARDSSGRCSSRECLSGRGASERLPTGWGGGAFTF